METASADPDGCVVSVRNLRKEFAGHTAVRDVSFDMRPGRIVGFLGPNGAGKTTTLRMLLGLLEPTAGQAHVYGRPYAELTAPAAQVGVSFGTESFLPGRTGRGHLRCYAGLSGCDDRRVDELLSVVGLSEAARRPVKGYSTGMKQRLSLATALLGDPDLLVLDEPSNGLDPEGMLWLRQTLREFAGQGKSVLLSSHLLREMEHLVDDVVLLHRGRLLHAGPLDALLHRGQCVVRPGRTERERLLAALGTDGRRHRELPDGRIWVGESADGLRGLLRQEDLTEAQATVSAGDLESVFMALTGSAEGGLDA